MAGRHSRCRSALLWLVLVAACASVAAATQSALVLRGGSLHIKPSCCYYMNSKCAVNCYDANQQRLHELLYTFRNAGADPDLFGFRLPYTTKATLCGASLLCNGTTTVRSNSAYDMTASLLQLSTPAAATNSSLQLRANNTVQILGTSGSFTATTWRLGRLNFFDVVRSSVAFVHSVLDWRNWALHYLQDSTVSFAGSRVRYTDTMLGFFNSSLALSNSSMAFSATGSNASYSDMYMSLVPALHGRDGVLRLVNSSLELSNVHTAFMLRTKVELVSSTLVLRNSKLYLFEGSLHLTGSTIVVEQGSELWLYSNPVIGDASLVGPAGQGQLGVGQDVNVTRGNTTYVLQS